MENGILIASMVVPAISETMSLSSFINLFIKVDLPALGLPKMAIFFPSGKSLSDSGNEFFIYDFKSVMFIECSALTSKIFFIPCLSKSSLIKESDFLSTLFNTVMYFLFNFLNLPRYLNPLY